MENLGPRSATGEGAAALSPQRSQVLEELRRGGTLTVTALAAALGLHENTVREHLEGLVGLRLVTRQRAESSGRGRPGWAYRALPAQQSPAIRDHVALATALAGHLARTSSRPDADARAAGRDWGAALVADRPGADSAVQARHQVVDLLAELGFGPQADPRHRVVQLRTCPILDAARQYPQVVCGVHAGLVSAALEGLGSPQDAAAVVLEPFALPGACLLRIGGQDPTGAERAPTPTGRRPPRTGEEQPRTGQEPTRSQPRRSGRLDRTDRSRDR